jgi:hypothetical protein
MTWEFTGGDLLAGGIAVISLVVALWSARKQAESGSVANDLHEQANALQERLTRIEEARREEEMRRSTQADICLSLVSKRDPRRPLDYQLVVTNRGEASAKSVFIDVLPQGETVSSFNYDRALFPLEEVRPRADISIPVSLHRRTGEIFNVAVSWDGVNGRETKTQTLVPER